MRLNQYKQDALKQQIKSVLRHKDIKIQQQNISQLADELKISVLECAAALAVIQQSEIAKETSAVLSTKSKPGRAMPVLVKPKRVKYRLNVGLDHQVTEDEVGDVLVEVAGVDRKSIGKLDIRQFYTLVELPDGMPAEIFQLLAETEIRQQKLDIKRIKYKRRFKRRHVKKRAAKS